MAQNLQQIKFLSTPSARRATIRDSGRIYNIKISIHALREEGDAQRPGRPQMPYYFYPRPPRGGRPRAFVPASTTKIFLSTPSARRATVAVAQQRGYILLFLSTPSARRATRHWHIGHRRQRHFYPRPPRGGRLWEPDRKSLVKTFLSTPSARRATVLFLGLHR